MYSGEVLTVEETAALLGTSVATVRRHCATGAIPAAKVGRSWVIDATKLAKPRAASPRRRATSASGLCDLSRSLAQVKSQDLTRDLWVPDILRHEDDLRESESLLALAAQKLDLDVPFDAPTKVPVPKNSYFVRNAMNLSLADRVAYHSVVAQIAPKIETHLLPAVYSARLAHDRRRLLHSGRDAWMRWRSDARDALQTSDHWMIETDITAFFDCVLHSQLIQDLIGLGADHTLIAALREMLKAWQTAPGIGLPQGPDASRVLANFYLIPVDEALSQMPDIVYLRYLDDIRIVAPTKHAAITALKLLDVECKSRNLSLSTNKTKLTVGTSARESLQDRELDEARYVFDAGGDQLEVRKQLNKLFRKALKGSAGVNPRRARFGLYRLRAIRADSSLSLVLNHLEDLAPLGWLVPAYLAPWIGRPSVQLGLANYLLDPERNTSDYLSTWILAALLESPKPVKGRILEYARGIALDRSQSAYHRAVALNVLALGLHSRDLDSIRGVISSEYHPEIIRGGLVALARVGLLDKTISARARRIPSSAVTIDYLSGRRNLPSLVESGKQITLP